MNLFSYAQCALLLGGVLQVASWQITAPGIDSISPNQTVEIGSTAELQCTVWGALIERFYPDWSAKGSSSSEPNVELSHQDSCLVCEHDHRYSLSITDLNVANELEVPRKTFTLKIQNIRASDAKIYTCSASGFMRGSETKATTELRVVETATV